MRRAEAKGKSGEASPRIFGTEVGCATYLRDYSPVASDGHITHKCRIVQHASERALSDLAAAQESTEVKQRTFLVT